MPPGPRPASGGPPRTSRDEHFEVGKGANEQLSFGRVSVGAGAEDADVSLTSSPGTAMKTSAQPLAALGALKQGRLWPRAVRGSYAEGST